MYCEWHLDVSFATSYHHSAVSNISLFSPTNQNRVSQTVIHAYVPMHSSSFLAIKWREKKAITNPFLILLHGKSFTQLPGGHTWPQMQRKVTHESGIPRKESFSTDETCVVLDFLLALSQGTSRQSAGDLPMPRSLPWFSVMFIVGWELKSKEMTNLSVLSSPKPKLLRFILFQLPP